VSEDLDPRAAGGFVEPALAAELPGLRLDWMTVEGRVRASPPEVKRRLKTLSDRYRGASVIAMRTHPIPHAYRAFFHQIGLDPDVTRIPSEEAALSRLLQGRFYSCDLVRDALLIALVETGVPVWSLDADMVDPGGLGIRATVSGDRLGSGSGASVLAPGRLVVADNRCVHALLFGDIAPGHLPTTRSARITLFTVAVQGVPAIHVEEALWVCIESLRTE
jgi:DNA/RNA-binding domain of Phe-tRNA-synthetase-like protein